MRAETVAEQLFFVTVRIVGQSVDGKSWVGTGCIYAVETTAGTLHLMVTNRHVVEGANVIVVHFAQASSDGTLANGQSVNVTFTDFGPAFWSGHPDPAVDVAVIPVGEALNKLSQAGHQAFFRSLSPDLVPRADQLDALDALEEVIFVGYPSGIYDTVNHLPIARRGSAATPLQIDYEGRPAFVIDASVFPGSSGSPVFLYDRSMYSNRGGGTVVGSRFYFLGVLAAVHTRQVEGQVSELPARLAVQFDEPIDLGIVYRSSTVDTCVDELLVRAGLVRRDTKITEPTASTHADELMAEAVPHTEEAHAPSNN
jgi:hypothetical protein